MIRRHRGIIVLLGLTILLTLAVFRQFFLYGNIPVPASFQMAWYEPWKSAFSTNGIPTIVHKAVGDDVFRQIFPFRDLAAEILTSREVPLWNPYGGAGQPLLATLHTGIANPLSFLQLFDGITGWAWFIILQLPLLFLSTYWYMRAIGIGREGALLAAISLCLSGVAIVRYIYGDYLYALASLPLLLGCIERARTNRRILLAVPWITAFLLVSVQPQISGYVLIAVFSYGAILARPFILSFILFVAMGIGLSLIQLIPTLELYRAANVTATSSSFIFEKFLMPVQHLITIALPNFFGNIGTYNFWGTTDYVETAASIGLVPLTLAVIAVVLIRTSSRLFRTTRFLTWATVLCIIATLDFTVTAWVYRLPLPVLATSIPTRIYLLSTFFLAVLGGIGFDYVRTQKGRNMRGIIKIYGTLLITALCIIAVTYGMGRGGMLPCPSGVPHCISVAVRNGLFEIGVFITVGMIFFAGSIGRSQLFRKAVPVFTVIVLIGAGLYNASKFLPMSPREYVAKSHPVMERLRSLAPARVAGIGSGAFATDLSTQYRYFDTNYYDPLYIRRYGELVSYVNTGDEKQGITRSDVAVVSDATVSATLSSRRERFWDMTGTSVLITKKSEIATYPGIPIGEDAVWRLYGRPSVMPRAYLVNSLTVESDSQKTLARMFAPDTDLTKTAFVDTSILLVPDPKKPQGGTVTIDRYETQRITLSVEAAQDSFLVLSDTYYPGWKADIDGNEVPVYRTNYAFRGISVPEGTHIVRFYYDPLSWRIGLLGTLVSLIVWLLFFVRKSSK